MDGATYKLCNLATGEVSGIGPVRGTPDVLRGEVATLVSVADLLLTSIGGDNLAEWAEWMKETIEYRVMFGPIDLILCENHPNPAALVRQHLPFEGLGVAQAQVLRSCIEPTEEQVAEHGLLTVQVQDHWTLPFDGDALVDMVGSLMGLDA